MAVSITWVIDRPKNHESKFYVSKCPEVRKISNVAAPIHSFINTETITNLLDFFSVSNRTTTTKHVKRIYMRVVGSVDCVRQAQYGFLFGTRLTKSLYIKTLSFRSFTAIRIYQEKGDITISSRNFVIEF